MKKFLIGFFVLLSALLGGYHQSEAHESWGNTHDALAKSCGKSANTSLDAGQEGMACIHKPTSSNKGVFRTDPTEAREEKEEDEEDHGYISLKKHLDSSNYFTSILLVRSIGYFFTPGKRISTFSKYFSYTASYRYLVLQVFRI